MFFRTKRSGKRTYVQIVENQRQEQGGSAQKVLVTLGRLDRLKAACALQGLLESGGRLAEGLTVVSTHPRGVAPTVRARWIGASIAERLWRDLGCRAELGGLDPELERLAFANALHHLFDPGASRGLDAFVRRSGLKGLSEAEGPHIKGALHSLGSEPEQSASPKEALEEKLFAERRDLFSGVEVIVAFGDPVDARVEPGETLLFPGLTERRPLAMGLAVDARGRPISGLVAPLAADPDHQALAWIEALRDRFQLEQVTLVAFRDSLTGRRRRFPKSVRRVVVDELPKEDDEEHAGLAEPLLVLKRLRRSFAARLVARGRSMASIDELRGELLCGQLALLLRNELLHRAACQGAPMTWNEVADALEELQVVRLDKQGETLHLADRACAQHHALFRAAGLRPPPAVRVGGH